MTGWMEDVSFKFPKKKSLPSLSKAKCTPHLRSMRDINLFNILKGKAVKYRLTREEEYPQRGNEQREKSGTTSEEGAVPGVTLCKC